MPLKNCSAFQRLEIKYSGSYLGLLLGKIVGIDPRISPSPYYKID